MGCGSSSADAVKPMGAQGSVDAVVRATKMPRSKAKTLHKNFYNAATDGRMTMAQFTNYFLTMHKKEKGDLAFDSFLTRFYLIFVKTSDAFVTFEEFAKTIYEITNGTLGEKLAVVFSMCDTDKGGSIDRSELIQTIMVTAPLFQMDPTPTASQTTTFANNAFDKMDLNGDGDVTEAEFVSAFLAPTGEIDSSVATIVLVFSALKRVLTGDPPIPKQLKTVVAE